MSCCTGPLSAQDLVADPIAVGRRVLLTGAMAAPFSIGAAMAASKTIRIGFCSQLLCAPPYMVAQAGGFFKAEGLEVEIVNLRGSPSSAMAASKTIRIGFCSQLLCAPPYMVAQAGGFFKAEGLEVEIVNLRGSP